MAGKRIQSWEESLRVTKKEVPWWGVIVVGFVLFYLCGDIFGFAKPDTTSWVIGIAVFAAYQVESWLVGCVEIIVAVVKEESAKR